MREEYRDDDVEIDLMEILHVFLKKWWLIVIVGILGGALSFLGTKMFITPMYESNAMIYLLSKSNAITSALDIQLGNQITDDFMILATSRPVVETVIEDEKLDLTYEEMVDKITVSNPSNTQILKISVKDANPVVACELANAMAKATQKRVAEVMNTDEPNVVEEAIVTDEPVSPNTLKNTIIGGVVGAFLVMAVLLVNYMIDDRIKTEEDVAKYLELNTLASIPKMENMRKDQPQKKERKQTKTK